MNKILIGACLFLLACSKSGSDSGNTTNPAVSITDVVMAEGDEGLTTFLFTVTLDRSSNKTIQITYNTQDGSAGKGTDYTALVNQTISFLPNETSKNIAISVICDKEKENDETFIVTLSNAINATLVKSIATGTILNDDAVGSFNTLVWSDEFNDNILNAANWTFEIGDGCPNLCGWGNNELEYYTNRAENAYLENGNLIIKAIKEDLGGRNYTSARIISKDKKKFKYGRIDIRAKLPKGKGIWPAFWMLPQNNLYGTWPKSGEIDIMELVGHEPNVVHGTVHYGPGPGSTQISKSFSLNSGDFSNDYHVFSIKWDRNIIQWFVDDQLFSTVQNTDTGSSIYPFNEEFFFILNLAVGGNWPGNPDASTNFPQQLFIDYIRVYQ